MSSSKMNVLVYSGNGATIDSVRHCVHSLRRLLSANYAVIPVTDTALLKEPWTASCALLVFPGGADLGYCRSFNGEGNRRIEQYVRRGGSYLGFCAGGYYGSSRCEFEVDDKIMSVVGPRELQFYPGTCRGCAFKGFQYNTEDGTRAAYLNVDEAAFKSGTVPSTFASYYNGGGVFVDAGKFKDKGVETLASYTDPLAVDGGQGPAAVVYCKVGEGGAILTGTHPEFAAANLDPAAYKDLEVLKVLAENDEARVSFLKACLLKLGLVVSEEATLVPSLSRIHVSSMQSMHISKLLTAWKDIITINDGEEYILGENDTFQIEKEDSRWSLTSLSAALLPNANVEPVDDKIVDYDSITKHLVPHEVDWPQPKHTPYFNHHSFFRNLEKYQQESRDEVCEFGNHLLYGEVVTSTNTLLEKNPKFLNTLPVGTTFTATTQIAGRGRGSNVWVSPAGQLILSTYLQHPVAAGPSASVVFIQYLAAIAMVEAVHNYDTGYSDLPVKLKWPNDIYARDPTKAGKEYVKIGGILVNTSYSGSSYSVVLGLGLNTTNAAPTTSLNALLPPTLAHFTIEKLLARFLTSFEGIYRSFCRTGFDATLEATYYKHWLHTDQIVTLENEGGARARIKGITRNWGLLRAEELGWEDRPTGKVWELQTDSNSFDFFKGLLKSKS